MSYLAMSPFETRALTLFQIPPLHTQKFPLVFSCGESVSGLHAPDGSLLTLVTVRAFELDDAIWTLVNGAGVPAVHGTSHWR
jgi:hypothetical protein